MKVLIFDDRPHRAYGAKRTMLSLGVGLRDLGHDVTISSTECGVWLEMAAADGLQVHPLHDRAPSALDATRGSFRTGGPAKKVSIGVQALLSAAKLRRVVEAGGFDVVVVSSTRSSHYCALVGKPVVRYVQISDADRLMNRLARRSVAHHVGLAEAMLEPLPKRCRNRSSVVPLGVALSTFEALSLPAPPDDQLRLVSVGAIAPRKGVHDSIEAVSILAELVEQPVSLRIVGAVVGSDHREYEASLKATAAESGARIEFVGFSDDVAAELANAHAILHLASQEGLPRVIVEAMAAGRPAVCTPVGGIGETVVDGQNGLLVPPGRPQAAAEALRALLDPEFFASLSNAARAVAVSRHSLPSMIVGIEAALETLLDDGRRRL